VLCFSSHRLQDLKRRHAKVLQEMIMDIIRALGSANLDIRKKTLEVRLSTKQV